MPVSIDRMPNKPHIQRGANGTAASVRPVQGQGPQGLAGPGNSNADVAGYVTGAGPTQTALQASIVAQVAALTPTLVGIDTDGVAYLFTLGVDPLPSQLAILLTDTDGTPYVQPLPRVAYDTDGTPYFATPTLIGA